MRQSFLFTKTRKDAPKDEESSNAKLLIRAGYIHKEMAGVYSLLPLGVRVIRKIERIIRDEMERIGGQEILMSALHPKKNWDQTNRWEQYDALFRFQSFYSKIDYVLGPTHEEIVSPLLKEYIFSYRDLPVSVFQIQNKFRDEKRAKSGILRGREFAMKDMYSFHADEQDLQRHYEKVKKAYVRIFKQAGIGASTHLTFASGGTFSKYSHEFQAISDAGEDTIHLCQACGIAVNEEIIAEQSSCPECSGKNLIPNKAVEVGNIFQLKTKFSQPFRLTYRDKGGNTKEVQMGCYGIGLGRLMGVVAELFHDERGLIWPSSVAPFAVHLLAFPGGSKEAETLYARLRERGVEVLYDDRAEITQGEKLYDADLIGIPIRMIVSERTLKTKSVEVKKRSAQKTNSIPITQAGVCAL